MEQRHQPCAMSTLCVGFDRKMTGEAVAQGSARYGRRHLGAARLRDRATRVEFTAARALDVARHLALELERRAHGVGIGFRARRQECPCVGVARTLEHVARRALLDEPSQIHDSHAIGEMQHDLQIVRNDQYRDTMTGLQFEQQVENFALHRDIQSGGGLIGDEQPRGQRQRARDTDPASLSSAQLADSDRGIPHSARPSAATGAPARRDRHP